MLEKVIEKAKENKMQIILCAREDETIKVSWEIEIDGHKYGDYINLTEKQSKDEKIILNTIDVFVNQKNVVMESLKK